MEGTANVSDHKVTWNVDSYVSRFCQLDAGDTQFFVRFQEALNSGRSFLISLSNLNVYMYVYWL